jgi:hypothetical protein
LFVGLLEVYNKTNELERLEEAGRLFEWVFW